MYKMQVFSKGELIGIFEYPPHGKQLMMDEMLEYLSYGMEVKITQGIQ